MKLALVVGHTENSPGAYAKNPINEYEYTWNNMLCDKMLVHAQTITGIQTEKFLRDNVGIVEAYRQARNWGATASIELHFNSAGPSATGTEMLYVTPVSIPLAQAVQDATIDTLGLRDRKIKNASTYNYGRGSKNLSQMGRYPSILTEPFFGSNAKDCAIVNRNINELAIAQIEAAAGVLLGHSLDEDWEVTASALNVRGGPGTQFERLGWGPLSRGTKVEVLAWEGDWAKIATNQGVAYVYGSFLT